MELKSGLGQPSSKSVRVAFPLNSSFMGEEEGSTALTLSHPNLVLSPAGT